MKRQWGLGYSFVLRRQCLLWCICLFAAVCGGCGLTDQSMEKVQDLDYTVLDTDGIPEKLLEEIEKQQEESFQFTYQDGAYLYIAYGFGAQDTGGYSIQVRELYLTSDAIYFEAELFGPQKGETVSQSKSCPYIVVKLEQREESVIFG